MTDTGPVIDIYSGLDHKVGMGETVGQGINAAPKYLDEANARRINAYRRLQAYVETVARLFLPDDSRDPRAVAEHREYGDVAVMVERVAAAMLGDDPHVSIVGADAHIPDQPEIPPAPQPPAEGLQEAEARIAQQVFQEATRVWEVNARSILDGWTADLELVPLLTERQDWLRNWSTVDRFIAKASENEKENIVPLGDGVMVFGWDAAKKRPTVEVFEPDAYVPVLSDSKPREFPNRVHLAWIFIDDSSGEEVEMVRRITYELIDIESDDAAGLDVGSRPLYLAPDADWTMSCLYSEGVWPLEEIERLDNGPWGAGSFDSLVTWEQVEVDGQLVDAERIPIGLDVIPVVHFVNTESGRQHFGRAFSTRITQLIDELAYEDRNVSLASAWAARPPMAVSGMAPGAASLDLTPGQSINLGDDGAISTIDMAANLSTLLGGIDQHLRRISVNSQVPEGLLGRIGADEVPSGIAFTLSFTAFEQLVNGGRQARDHKYRLCLKMVQRIAIQNQDETLNGSTEVYDAELVFGPFMPQDLLGTAQVLKILSDSKLVSQKTGILMAAEDGVPSGDGAEALSAIRETMTQEADQITAALEDPKYAADFLGVQGFVESEGPDDQGGVGVPDEGIV